MQCKFYHDGESIVVIQYIPYVKYPLIYAVWCQAPEKPFLIIEIKFLFSALHTVPFKHSNMSGLMNVDVFNPCKSSEHEAASDICKRLKCFRLMWVFVIYSFSLCRFPPAKLDAAKTFVCWS